MGFSTFFPLVSIWLTKRSSPTILFSLRRYHFFFCLTFMFFFPLGIDRISYSTLCLTSNRIDPVSIQFIAVSHTTNNRQTNITSRPDQLQQKIVFCKIFTIISYICYYGEIDVTLDVLYVSCPLPHHFVTKHNINSMNMRGALDKRDRPLTKCQYYQNWNIY